MTHSREIGKIDFLLKYPPIYAIQSEKTNIKNRIITLIRGDTLKALANIEFTLISLQKMGSYYSDKPVKEYQKLQPSSLRMIRHSATNPR